MLKTLKKPAKAKQSVTGRYVYDSKTDKIVKVSDRASVASRKSSGSPRQGGCGSGPCGSGACGRS